MEDGADARAVRMDRERDGGHSRGEERGGGAGAADRGEQLGHRCDDRRRQREAERCQLTVQRSGTGFLGEDGSSADCRAGGYGKRYAGRAQGGGGEPDVRETVPGGAERGGAAVLRRGARERDRDCGGSEGQPLLEREGRGAALVLQALETGQRDQLAGVLR